MGARNMTPTEYGYIKELLGKNKNKTGRVAKITGRSQATVRYIAKSVDFAEYEKIRPQGSQERKPKTVVASTQQSLLSPSDQKVARLIPAKPKSSEKEKLQPERKDYSGAILSQTAALVKAMYALNGTMSRVEYLLKNPKFYADGTRVPTPITPPANAQYGQDYVAPQKTSVGALLFLSFLSAILLVVITVLIAKFVPLGI